MWNLPLSDWSEYPLFEYLDPLSETACNFYLFLACIRDNKTSDNAGPNVMH